MVAVVSLGVGCGGRVSLEKLVCIRSIMYKGWRCHWADSCAFFLVRRGLPFSVTCSVAVLLWCRGMVEESMVEEDMATWYSMDVFTELWMTLFYSSPCLFMYLVLYSWYRWSTESGHSTSVAPYVPNEKPMGKPVGNLWTHAQGMGSARVEKPNLYPYPTTPYP